MAAASLLAVVAAGCDDSEPLAVAESPADSLAVPSQAIATSGYTAVVGDDWQAYADKNQLKAADLFWWVDSAQRDVYQYVDIVSDPTFGKAARITFPANTGSSGSSPRIAKDLPVALDKMWYRWKMKFSPGWTSAGPDPAGWANSYKIAFWTWKGYSGRGEIEYSNTNQYITGTGVIDGAGKSLSYSESLLPGSAANFGSTATEWSDGEWYEFVVYYEKTGATTAKQHYWRRKLTSGGKVVSNSWIYHGYQLSGATTPQVARVELGINRNKNTPSTMYIYWGPWEVVDGARYANPFGMPNVSGTPSGGGGTTPAPTVTGLVVTPGTATAAPSGKVQFSAQFQMSDGTKQAATAAWTASGGSVTSAGLYTAPATAGTYRVIASASGKADTSTVTVSATAATLTQLVLSPGSASVQAGKTVQFSASGKYSDGSTKAVVPTYSATGGTISSSGLYTAGATAGTFRVIATSGGKADTSSVVVSAATSGASLTRVVLTPYRVSSQAGGSTQFTLTGTYSDGTSKAVAATWSATGGTVSSTGLYKAGTTGGSFKVIARAANGMADTSTVDVSAPTTATLTRVLLTPYRVNLARGGSAQFTLTGTYSNGTSKAVAATWSATGGTVSSTGLYKAGTSVGTYRVIASSGGKADTSTVVIQ